MASGEPRLQILITYNGAMSTHAAVRLEHPGRGTLFWDPAGLYGQAGSDAQGSRPAGVVQRYHDVIWEHAPTLPAYWQFAEGTGDTAMEILEWRLSSSRVEYLYATLVAGAQPGGSNGFATATSEPFCAIAVSDFLRRYGGGIVRVSDSYLFPASLAELLRKQKPDRILVFGRDNLPVEFRTN